MKDVVLREIPKTMMHTIIEMNSNNTNMQMQKSNMKLKKLRNVVIRGMLWDEYDSALSLVENIAKFVEDHLWNMLL